MGAFFIQLYLYQNYLLPVRIPVGCAVSSRRCLHQQYSKNYFYNFFIFN